VYPTRVPVNTAHCVHVTRHVIDTLWRGCQHSPQPQLDTQYTGPYVEARHKSPLELLDYIAMEQIVVLNYARQNVEDRKALGQPLTKVGGAVQVDSIKTRVERVYGFSALN
jgi:hypothetical protein